MLTRFRAFAVPLLLCLALGGCTTGVAPTGTNPTIPESASSAVLRAGDSLTVALQGVPDASNWSVQIDEQGLITLPHIGSVNAAGLSAATLSQRISQTYIARNIYTAVTANVTVTERYIFVGGEVATPGRIIWSSDLTATKAVQAAGGFSLYAKETAVDLIRDGKAYTIDLKLAQRNPSQDARLLPGDSLQVPRSRF